MNKVWIECDECRRTLAAVLDDESLDEWAARNGWEYGTSDADGERIYFCPECCGDENYPSIAPGAITDARLAADAYPPSAREMKQAWRERAEWARRKGL